MPAEILLSNPPKKKAVKAAKKTKKGGGNRRGFFLMPDMKLVGIGAAGASVNRFLTPVIAAKLNIDALNSFEGRLVAKAAMGVGIGSAVGSFMGRASGIAYATGSLIDVGIDLADKFLLPMIDKIVNPQPAQGGGGVGEWVNYTARSVPAMLAPEANIAGYDTPLLGSEVPILG